jgi:hypothetical protein
MVNLQAERKWQEKPEDVLRTMKKLSSELNQSGAFYYWAYQWQIHPSFESYIDRKNTNADSLKQHRKYLIDQCVRLSPDWPRVLLLRLESMSSEECDQAFGDKLEHLAQNDTTTSEYNYILYKYYQKHRPYDLQRSYDRLRKSCEQNTNPKAVEDFISIFSAGLADLTLFHIWWYTELLHLERNPEDWQLINKWVDALVSNNPKNDEVKYQVGFLSSYIHAACSYGRSAEIHKLVQKAPASLQSGWMAEIVSNLAEYIWNDTLLMHTQDSLVKSNLRYRHTPFSFSNPDLELQYCKLQQISELEELQPYLEIQKRKVESMRHLASRSEWCNYIWLNRDELHQDYPIEELIDSLLIDMQNRKIASDNLLWTLRGLLEALNDTARTDAFRKSNFLQNMSIEEEPNIKSSYDLNDYKVFFNLLYFNQTHQCDSIMKIITDQHSNTKSKLSIFTIYYYSKSSIDKCPTMKEYFINNPSLANFKTLMTRQMYVEAFEMYNKLKQDKTITIDYFNELDYIHICIELKEFEKAAKTLKELIVSMSSEGSMFANSDGYFENATYYDEFLKSPELEKEMREIYVYPNKN